MKKRQTNNNVFLTSLHACHDPVYCCLIFTVISDSYPRVLGISVIYPVTQYHRIDLLSLVTATNQKENNKNLKIEIVPVTGWIHSGILENPAGSTYPLILIFEFLISFFIIIFFFSLSRGKFTLNSWLVLRSIISLAHSVCSFLSTLNPVFWKVDPSSLTYV